MIQKKKAEWQLYPVPGTNRTPGASPNDPFTDEDIERLRQFFVLIRSILIRLKTEGYVIEDGKIIYSPYDHDNRTTHTQSNPERQVS